MDVIDRTADLGRIAEQNNVEVLEVGIVLQQRWKFAPCGVIGGIKPMHEND